MLVGILFILFDLGTTNVLVLLLHQFTPERQILLWLSFFASFAIKIPVLPLHIWLCEAHVESPTVGSVLLAGLLLKVGLYGLVRFSFRFFSSANVYFMPLLYLVSVISIFYSSFTAIRQVDLKKIIAYSSIAHMNFTLLGLNSHTVQGVEGALFLMLCHGLVASGLFISVGVLYDRYHNRLLVYYSGLAIVMPLFSTVFFLFLLANLFYNFTAMFSNYYWKKCSMLF